MIKGVTEKEEDIIKEILGNYSYDFYYYGSRVKGDYNIASDLDILIKTESEIPQNIMEEINLKFNKSLIPYKVNFSIYSNMSEDFYKLIEKDLIKIETV